MTPSKIKEVLKDAFQNNEQILLVGSPGIGKTDLVKGACDEVNADLITFHPAVSDPTDFKGLPARSSDGTHADFLPFGEIFQAINAKKLTVCFLDDLGQASESVQKALMQLLLGRRLNGIKLSDKIVFCGATNDINQRAGVSGLIEPVKSRWDSILKMDVSLDDWCQWAITNGMPNELIAFIRTRPELLSKFEATKDLTNSPSPRTWASVGRRVKRGVQNFELLAGAVGQGPATEFLAYLEMAKDAPSLDAILADPENAKIPEKAALMYLVAGGLAMRATETNFPRVFKYLSRMSQPFRVMSLRDAVLKNKSLANTETFVSWVCNEGNNIL